MPAVLVLESLVVQEANVIQFITVRHLLHYLNYTLVALKELFILLNFLIPSVFCLTCFEELKESRAGKFYLHKRRNDFPTKVQINSQISELLCRFSSCAYTKGLILRRIFPVRRAIARETSLFAISAFSSHTLKLLSPMSISHSAKARHTRNSCIQFSA